MKIKEIYQREQITEESWTDIAKAAYAGATGQKDKFGADKPNQYNAEIAKSQEGADWLTKNFIGQANKVKAPTPESYQQIAQQLLNQLLSNQTSSFQNILSKLSKKSPKFQTLLTKTGLGRPGTDIETFIDGVKSSFGNVPELNSQLDKLGTTHDEIISKAAQYQAGQKIDPALQQDMAGFSAAWYNLPATLQYAADRSIQSGRYGERWVDAGQGIEIKPASVLDRSIQARYQNEVYFYDNRSKSWQDSAYGPVSPNVALQLNTALTKVQDKNKFNSVSPGTADQASGAPAAASQSSPDSTKAQPQAGMDSDRFGNMVQNLTNKSTANTTTAEPQAGMDANRFGNMISSLAGQNAASSAGSTTAQKAQSQAGSQQPVMIKGKSGMEFQYNDKDKTWSASGEIISDPRMVQRLNQLALPQFQNRAMGLKTRGGAK
jgi:hypothetical protein